MSPYYSHKYTNNLMCLNFSVKCECFGLFYTSLISVDEEVAGTHLGHSSIYNMCCMMQDVKLVCQIPPFSEFKIIKQYMFEMHVLV